MKRYPNLTIAAILTVLLVFATLQSMYVDHLRESDRFYRWMLTASTQIRLFGSPSMVSETIDETEYRDEELFDALVEATEQELPDIPLTADDYDGEGNPLPKVVRYTAPRDIEEQQEAEGSSGLDTPEQIARDHALWRLARSDKLAEVRAGFLEASRQGELSSVGTQFGLGDMYGGGQAEEGGVQQGPVSLANVFFGFRKMAANLLWLQVDKFYHEGHTQRMVPLMNTCVMLDPSFIDAYLVGAWHLAYNATAGLDETPWSIRKYSEKHDDWVGRKEGLYYQGIEFLEDGIRKNPREYKLYFDAGYAIYEEKLQDHVNSVKYLSEAVRLWHDVWVPRTLYRCMGYNEQYEAAKKGWERYSKKYAETHPRSAGEIAPRFIRINQARIYERDARYAETRADAAAEIAERLTKQAQELLASGDQAAGKAEALLQQAEEYRARAENESAKHDELREKGTAIWNELLDMTGGVETAALAGVARIEARRLAREDRPHEAIGLLEKVRLDSADFYWEALNMIIEIKQESGIPLSLTEKRYLQRQALSEQYTTLLPKSLAAKEFKFDVEDRCWHQKGYDGSEPTLVEAGSLDLLKLELEHPVVARYLRDLVGPVVFEAGENWYRCNRPLPEDLVLPQPRNA